MVVLLSDDHVAVELAADERGAMELSARDVDTALALAIVAAGRGPGGRACPSPVAARVVFGQQSGRRTAARHLDPREVREALYLCPHFLVAVGGDIALPDHRVVPVGGDNDGERV